MNVWTFVLLLLGFGFLFRLGNRNSRMGWVTWAVPFVLYGLLQIGHVTESDAFLGFYLLVFALGGLLCGVGIQCRKFFVVRR